MKYSPTPRDLFNPPPQAFPRFSKQDRIESLRDAVSDVYPCGGDEWFLLTGIIDILEDHEELLGVK